MNCIKVETVYQPSDALESIVADSDKSFTGMVGSISKYFPSLKTKFDAALQSFDNWPKLQSITSLANLNSFIKQQDMSVSDFRVFEKVKVKVPEGFTGNLKEYSDFLDRSWLFLQLTALPLLDVYYGALTSFASNKDSKISLLDSSSTYKKMEQEYVSLVKESESYFGKTRHTSSFGLLGDCFGDYQQYRETSTKVHKLAKDLNTKQITSIHDKVKRISKVLDVIIEDATRGSYEKASYESVKSLAEGIYALAEIIEFYPVTYYRINELAVVMTDNKAIVDKLK